MSTTAPSYAPPELPAASSLGDSTSAKPVVGTADASPTWWERVRRPADRDDAPGARAQRAYTLWATWGALIPLAAASYNIWSVLVELGGFDRRLAVVPAVALELAAFISLMGARADAKNGREPRSGEMYVIASLSGFVGMLHWFIERTGDGFALSDFAWSIGPTAVLLGLLSAVWPVFGARSLHKAFVGEREAVTGSTRAQRREAVRAARVERHARALVHEWVKAREVLRELRRADGDPRKIQIAGEAALAARSKAMSAGKFWEGLHREFFPGMTIVEFEAAARQWSELLVAADEHGAVIDSLGVPGVVSPLDYVRTPGDPTPVPAHGDVDGPQRATTDGGTAARPEHVAPSSVDEPDVVVRTVAAAERAERVTERAAPPKREEPATDTGAQKVAKLDAAVQIVMAEPEILGADMAARLTERGFPTAERTGRTYIRKARAYVDGDEEQDPAVQLVAV